MTETAGTNADANKDVIAVERVIPAPPEKIFALITDPSRHQEIDGSGTVRDAKEMPDHLELGSKFGMSMKVGLPYSSQNTVVEFVPNRCVAWQTYMPMKLAGGRIWRYELEPVEGGTRVRETRDVSKEMAVSKPFVGIGRDHTRKAMEKSLERIEELTTNP